MVIACITGQIVDTGTADQGIVTTTAFQIVFVCATRQGIVVITAGQLIPAGVAGKKVLAGLAEQRVVVAAAFESIVASVAAQGVVARATVQQVIALAGQRREVRVAVQIVIAIATDKGIATGESLQNIVAGVPIQSVVALFGDRRAAGVALQVVIAAAPLQFVPAASADQGVVAGTAFEGIVISAAMQKIFAVTADQEVVAILAPQDVVVVTPVDIVIASSGPDHIVALVAGNRVVATAGGAFLELAIDGRELEDEVKTVALDTPGTVNKTILIAKKIVIAAQTAKKVIAGSTVEEIRAGRPIQDVMAALTRDEVTALVVAGFPDLESKRLGSVGKDDVVGVTTGQQIESPGTAFDGIAPASADHEIHLLATDDPVVASTLSDEGLVLASGVRNRQRHIEAIAENHVVVADAVVQDVRCSGNGNRRIADRVLQFVIPGLDAFQCRIEVYDLSITDDFPGDFGSVRSLREPDAKVAFGKGFRAAVVVEGERRTVIEGENAWGVELDLEAFVADEGVGVRIWVLDEKTGDQFAVVFEEVPAGIDDTIVAVAAVDDVGVFAVATDQDVVAGSPVQRVVIASAIECIVIGVAFEIVGTVFAVEGVVAGAAVEMVVYFTAGKHVGLAVAEGVAPDTGQGAVGREALGDLGGTEGIFEISAVRLIAMIVLFRVEGHLLRVFVIGVEPQQALPEIGAVAQPGVTDPERKRVCTVGKSGPVRRPVRVEVAPGTTQCGFQNFRMVGRQHEGAQGVQRGKSGEVAACCVLDVGVDHLERQLAGKSAVGFAAGDVVEPGVERIAAGVASDVAGLREGVAVEAALQAQRVRLRAEQQVGEGIDDGLQNIPLGLALRAAVAFCLMPGGLAQDRIEGCRGGGALRFGNQLQQGVLDTQRVDDQHQAVVVAEVVDRVVVDQALEVARLERLLGHFGENIATRERLIFNEDPDVAAVVPQGMRRCRPYRGGRFPTDEIILVGEQGLPVSLLADTAHDTAEEAGGDGSFCGKGNRQPVVEVESPDLLGGDRFRRACRTLSFAAGGEPGDTYDIRLQLGDLLECGLQTLLLMGESLTCGVADQITGQRAAANRIGRLRHRPTAVGEMAAHLAIEGGDRRRRGREGKGHPFGVAAQVVEGIERGPQAVGKPPALHLADAGAIEGDDFLDVVGVQEVKGGGQMPAEAITGDRERLALEFARIAAQFVVPGFHVGDLPPRPTGLLDLLDVGCLVVAHRVVDEFG